MLVVTQRLLTGTSLRWLVNEKLTYIRADTKLIKLWLCTRICNPLNAVVHVSGGSGISCLKLKTSYQPYTVKYKKVVVYARKLSQSLPHIADGFNDLRISLFIFWINELSQWEYKCLWMTRISFSLFKFISLCVQYIVDLCLSSCEY